MNAILAFLAAGAILAAPPSQPEFVTSDPNAGWSQGGYYVHNNMWNSSKYSPCTQTLTARSHDKWNVVARMNNKTGDGAVKTYPNVHKDYRSVPISSFESLSSTFAETSPHVGIYNVAYDLWINGVASPGCSEIMIWTENFHQVPGGRFVEEATISGHHFKVYRTARGNYIAFVAATNFASGTLELLDVMKWVIGKGWLADSATVNQICFGVEIVSTDDAPAKFEVSALSIEQKLKAKPDRAAAPMGSGLRPCGHQAMLQHDCL